MNGPAFRAVIAVFFVLAQGLVASREGLRVT